MNIGKAIRELQDEKQRLDRVIASLEEMQRIEPAAGAALPEKKRGRKSMDKQARRDVSERMKRYWSARRSADQPVQHGKA